MRKRLLAYGVAVVLVGGVGLLAQQFPPPGEYTVYQPGGSQSCGAWVADDRATPTPVSYARTAWFLGFVSGYGASSSERGQSLRMTDADAMFAWIDNYCQAHPLETIATAAGVLVLELKQ